MEEERHHIVSQSHVQVLPEDMLADVLRCLAPRSLAVCRCVCKAWQTVIDERRLLRTELLPLSVGGIFIHFRMLGLPEFFSCGASMSTKTTGHRRAVVSGDLSYARPNDYVQGHCNGLLLRWRSVVNPATRQWAPLPPLPQSVEGNATKPAYIGNSYLVFDPAISPHYEVFFMPLIPWWMVSQEYHDDPIMARSEWPPSLCETFVFSSRTGRWEERSFVRRGEPAESLADVAQAHEMTDKHYSAYWHGALYLDCRNSFFCRVSLDTNEYQVIQPPVKIGPGSRSQECYLGRSEKGVYCAILDSRSRVFRVWILDESSSGHGHGRQMKWVLKHRNDNLKKTLESDLDYSYRYRPDDDCDGARYWSLKDINHRATFPEVYHQDGSDDDDKEPVKPNKFTNSYYVNILGLHPFKEIVYLSNCDSIGLAYHLNTSKVQYLGNIYPKYYGEVAGQHAGIESSFLYTPCWMENSFPGST